MASLESPPALESLSWLLKSLGIKQFAPSRKFAVTWTSWSTGCCHEQVYYTLYASLSVRLHLPQVWIIPALIHLIFSNYYFCSCLYKEPLSTKTGIRRLIISVPKLSIHVKMTVSMQMHMAQDQVCTSHQCVIMSAIFNWTKATAYCSMMLIGKW